MSKHSNEKLKIMAEDTLAHLHNGDPASKFKAQQVVMYVSALTGLNQNQVIYKIKELLK